VIKRGVARCESDTLTLDDLQLKLQLVEAPVVWNGAHGASTTGLTLAEAERAHLLRVLTLTRWVKSEAARLLDISRPTLDRKIQQFGLLPEGE
jgi:transcriptional regulator of acetoin/glycerol metabolism